MKDLKNPKNTNPTGGKGKGKGGRKPSLTTLHPSLNLLPNNQSFKKIPSLHIKQSLEQGKKFGARRQSKSQ
jgi:hypothetical protein